MKFEEALGKVKKGENPSGINPIQYRVLLLAEPVGETTESGIITKPKSIVEKETWAQTRGYVVALSDMAFTNDQTRWACALPSAGDKVLYAKYAGQLIEQDGITYRMVKDEDILGVIV